MGLIVMMKKRVQEGEIEMLAKPHQIYNTLVAGIEINESLAVTERIYGSEEDAVAHQHYAQYQRKILKDYFGVDYEPS